MTANSSMNPVNGWLESDFTLYAILPRKSPLKVVF